MPFLQGLNIVLNDLDYFINQLQNLSVQQLTQVYDSINQMAQSHKTYYVLIHRFKKLLKAVTDMTYALDLNQAMKRICDECCECLECERTLLLIVDFEKNDIWTKLHQDSNDRIKFQIGQGIIGICARDGTIKSLTDAYSDPNFNSEIDKQSTQKTKTLLSYPIIDVNTRKIIAVVQAINKRRGVFTKDDEGLLQILSSEIAIVLNNSQQYDQNQMLMSNLRHVQKASNILNSQYLMKNLLQAAEHSLKIIMGCDKAQVYLTMNLPRYPSKLKYNEILCGQELINQTEKQYLLKFINGNISAYPIDIGIAGNVYETGQIVNIPNGSQNLLYNSTVDIQTSLPIIGFPIKNQKTYEILGIIQVINTQGIQGMGFNKKAKVSSIYFETLELFAEGLAQSILNSYCWEQYYDQITVDNKLIDLINESPEELEIQQTIQDCLQNKSKQGGDIQVLQPPKMKSVEESKREFEKKYKEEQLFQQEKKKKDEELEYQKLFESKKLSQK